MRRNPIVQVVAGGTMLTAFVIGFMQLGLAWIFPLVLLYWLARVILDIRSSDGFVRETVGGKLAVLFGLLIVNIIVYSLLYGLGWGTVQILS